MKFLFEASTVDGDKLYFYLIYHTVENSYSAEIEGQPGIGCHFHRIKDWVADDPEKQRQADQLGEEVDRKVFIIHDLAPGEAPTVMW